jgi:hypothetical protein
MNLKNSTRRCLCRQKLRCVWSGEVRWAPFVVAMAFVAVALDMGCRRPELRAEPLSAQPAVDWRSAESVRAAIAQSMAPVRIGMSEMELRAAGCITPRASEHALVVMTTPSQLDPGFEVKTSRGTAGTVAVGTDGRVKVFRTYDPAFVVYGCIHVGSTYQELLARLDELGMHCSEPIFAGLMGAMIVAEAQPWLRFYFVSSEPQQKPGCTTEPYTMADITAMRDARMAKLRLDLKEGGGAPGRGEVGADARIDYIDVGGLSGPPTH